MIRKLLLSAAILALLNLTGCASVPMASVDEDTARKEFNAPSEGKAGLYIYRNSVFGGALKKTLSIDGVVIGETASKTYFYKELEPGEHALSTESEFSDNKLVIDFKKGLNYFVRQYLKLGVFVGGAGLELKNEEEGKKGVLECKLAADPVVKEADSAQ